MKTELKNKVLQWVKVPINIILILLTYVALRWLGLKGLAGILIGLAAMAYLLLSKNPMVVFFSDLFRKKDDTYERLKDVTKK